MLRFRKEATGAELHTQGFARFGVAERITHHCSWISHAVLTASVDQCVTALVLTFDPLTRRQIFL